MQAIATVTVGAGGAASIDFTNIPQTFTDLVVKLSGRSARSAQQADNLFITLNASGTGYTYRNLSGTGTAAGSANYASRYVSLALTAAGSTASTFSNIEIYIPNYASTTQNKSISTDAVSENNASNAQMDMNATLWANTAAITSLTLVPEVSTFVQHSTATLYGIKNS
jgi:hypothetical protein